MPAKLKDDPVLTRLRAAVGKAYGERLERVVLYGSRARGDHRPDSDYDIAVFIRDPGDLWDELGTLAEITARGRKTAEQATEDLMTARFGMGGYDVGELGQVFALLRGLRLAAGDFVAEPDEPGPAAGPGETHDHDLDVVRTTPTS